MTDARLVLGACHAAKCDGCPKFKGDKQDPSVCKCAHRASYHAHPSSATREFGACRSTKCDGCQMFDKSPEDDEDCRCGHGDNYHAPALPAASAASSAAASESKGSRNRFQLADGARQLLQSSNPVVAPAPLSAPYSFSAAAQATGKGATHAQAANVPIANPQNTWLVDAMMLEGQTLSQKGNNFSFTVFKALTHGIRPASFPITCGAEVISLPYCKEGIAKFVEKQFAAARKKRPAPEAEPQQQPQQKRAKLDHPMAMILGTATGGSGSSSGSAHAQRAPSPAAGARSNPSAPGSGLAEQAAALPPTSKPVVPAKRKSQTPPPFVMPLAVMAKTEPAVKAEPAESGKRNSPAAKASAKPGSAGAGSAELIELDDDDGHVAEAAVASGDDDADKSTMGKAKVPERIERTSVNGCLVRALQQFASDTDESDAFMSRSVLTEAAQSISQQLAVPKPPNITARNVSNKLGILAKMGWLKKDAASDSFQLTPAGQQEAVKMFGDVEVDLT